MSDRIAAMVTWGGGGLIVAAGIASVVLTLLSGEKVFAARLVAGLAGCL